MSIPECAGINRLGAEDERALHRRVVPHGGPESCAALREGRGEALTGVCAGRVLSPETSNSERRRCSGKRKAIRWWANGLAHRWLGGVVDPLHAQQLPVREPGDPRGTPPCGASSPRGGIGPERRQPQPGYARPAGVRQARSTDEAEEQSCVSSSGGRGGKASGRGEHA